MIFRGDFYGILGYFSEKLRLARLPSEKWVSRKMAILGLFLDRDPPLGGCEKKCALFFKVVF